MCSIHGHVVRAKTPRVCSSCEYYKKACLSIMAKFGQVHDDTYLGRDSLVHPRIKWLLSVDADGSQW